jgi:formiminotetrahydrofolate cyclodeaminase
MRRYFDDLAAKKPAPGGGSAAAASAAIGAGLMSMVARYTIGNPKYKDDEAAIAGILEASERYRLRLQELVDIDAEAYERLSSGLKKCGQDTAAQEVLYKEAVNPPYEICRITADALRACKDLARLGNKNLITDTAVAVILLEGAFFSAKFNVYINLKYVKDIDFIGSVHDVLAPLESSMPELKEEILEMCEDVISR